jgi:HEAT repeat protein
MFQKNVFITIFICLIGYSVVFSTGSKVIKYPQSDLSIQEKWKWAEEKSDQFDEGFWIGYSIEQTMCNNSFTGTFYNGPDRHKYDTLEKLIYNRGEKKDESITVSAAAKKALDRLDDKHNDEQHIEVVKEIAILIYFKNSSTNIEDISDIKLSNISLQVNLKNKPLIWLGICSQDESVDFLTNTYPKVEDNEIKEDLLHSIGMHKESKIPIDFFVNIIESEEISDIREDAVFWLGEHDNESSVDFIVEIAKTDRSSDVRKKAVFALYLMESKKAETALIDLAKHSKDRNVKNKAIFWLGQKAADKSADILEEIIESENETEVKEQAVFALAQLDNNEGVPALIDIAKNHENKEVRKKAIFWLGESGDERALDLIIDLIQNN